MGTLRDIGELLEKIPLWKKLKSLPDRVEALEKQLAVLQSEKQSNQLPNGYRFDESTATLVGSEGDPRLCSGCYYSKSQRQIPLKEQDHGWTCPVCHKFHENPNYKDPFSTTDDDLGIWGG